MNIQQEELTIKEFTSGTTLLFFSTSIDVISTIQDEDEEKVPSIIQLNNIGAPVALNSFDGENLWSMNSDNIYVPTSSITTNYITGYSYSINFSEILNPETLNNYRDRFLDSAEEVFSSPDFSGSSIFHQEYVFSKYHEIDDFFVNFKLNRTTATLDTLNVYNNLVNSIPSQESETGVVFGRLLALQSIRDSEGNNIRIPLRNVPIGIFNPSEDYPTSSSVLENGDRIFLNIKESASEDEYFNIESFDFDKNRLLRSASQFDLVPEQYKYVTKTNDEGEFVIPDVPVGTQILIFEVDLLKQGLTRDEIALNFFQFPPDDDAIIDQIPNFSFKQFPINVVPSWGTVQTGYTELDIVVNLDLRKWTTYFFPPISLYAKNLEASVSENAANTAKIEVRNMAKENFPKTDIKLAMVPDDLDRVSNQQLNWNIELAQIRNKSEFFKFACPILKLPANIYDPLGYRTDSDGVPTNSRGVWLSAYQLKIYSDPSGNPSRKTGAINAWNGSEMYTKSHFDLNYTLSNQNIIDGQPQIGIFPYEKPWSIDYPNVYSIPKKPTEQRYIYGPDRTQDASGNIFLDEPAYNDGDLVGYMVEDISGGFGSQNAFGIWFHNRIAQVMTKDFMYKYESEVAWNEKYANGYEPSNPGYPRFAGISRVVGGEKYQRFESGYGYFMRPSGWPRISRTEWGADTYYGRDIKHTGEGGFLGGDPENPGPGISPSSSIGNMLALNSHINDVYNLKNINLALSLDNVSLIKEGTLEAYRIINSNPDNLVQVGNFTIPTTVRLRCEKADRLYSLSIVNTGDVASRFRQNFNTPVRVNGVWVNQGQFIEIEPGQTVSLSNPLDGGLYDPRDTFKYTTHSLPGNAGFNPSTNRYESARYSLRFVINNDGDGVEGDNLKIVNFSKTAKVSPDTWYVKTQHEGGSNGVISPGVHAEYNGNRKVWYIRIEDNNNQIIL